MFVPVADEDMEEPLRRWKLPREMERSWPAWAGTKEDLVRIGEKVKEFADRRLQTELARVVPDEHLPDFEESRVRERWKTIAAGPHDPHESMAGMTKQVVDELDPLTIQRFVVDAGRDGYGDAADLRVSMSPLGGVTLALKSADAGWLADADETLSAEIKRCAQWWGVFRTDRARWAYVVATALLGLAIFVLPKSRNWVGVYDGLVTGAVAGYWLGRLVKRWVLPGFEVIHPGSTSKGRRALGVIAVVALQVLFTAGSLIYAAVQSSGKK